MTVAGSKIEKLLSVLEYSNIQEYEVEDKDIELMVLRCRYYNIASLLILPSSLPLVDPVVANCGIRVGVAVSYPSGAYSLEAKRDEIEDILSISLRIDELYLTMATGKFLSGDDRVVEGESSLLVELADGCKTGLIVEAGHMNKEQKRHVCSTASKAGIDYIVSTGGFMPYDIHLPTLKDIEELKGFCEGSTRIAAYSSSENPDDILDLINAGADKVISPFPEKILNK